MKGGSGVPKAAAMAQEEEDVRDYNLNETQKATKAKYPPVSRKYECECVARLSHLLSWPRLPLFCGRCFGRDPVSPWVVVSLVPVRGVRVGKPGLPRLQSS